MTIAFLLLMVAMICFGLSAFGVSARINLQSLGLALLTGAFLAGGMVL